MGVPRKLLSKDEVVIFQMHEHVKKILANIVGAFLVLVILGIALAFMPDSVLPWGQWTSAGIAAVLLIIIFVIPFIKWRTTIYIITNRRVITRSGVFSKIGHDIPLSRISNVAYDFGLIDRIFSCGTISLETSADNPLTLTDVPHASEVHVKLTDLIYQQNDHKDN